MGAMLAHHGLTVETAGSSAPEWTRHGGHHGLDDYRRAIRAHVGTTRARRFNARARSRYPRPNGRDKARRPRWRHRSRLSAPAWARRRHAASGDDHRRVIRARVGALDGMDGKGLVSPRYLPPRGRGRTCAADDERRAELSAPAWARRRRAARDGDLPRGIRARVGAAIESKTRLFLRASYPRPGGRDSSWLTPARNKDELFAPSWARREGLDRQGVG